MRGLFVVFEGSEGAGKSTQTTLLAQKLNAKGYPVIATREPGGTRIGEQIRAITHNPENNDLDPVAEAYLMAASRAQHVREVIEPALEEGKVVISDRFTDSSVAYQGFGRQLGEETIVALNAFAVNGMHPDVVFLLDAPVDVGLSRTGKEGKGKDRLDMQPREFYTRVQNGFLALAKKFPNLYVVINATAPVDEVASLIWSEIEKRLKTREQNT